MKKIDFGGGIIIDDFTPLITALKNEADKRAENEDSGVDYASEYKKQTGKDFETGEYVTQ